MKTKTKRRKRRKEKYKKKILHAHPLKRDPTQFTLNAMALLTSANVRKLSISN